MATKRKTGTLATAGKKVKDAAKTVVKKADKYIVEPVGRALGLKKKKTTSRKASARTTAAKTTTAKRGARSK